MRWADGCTVLALVFLGIFHCCTVQRTESYGADSSIYITLGRNLLEKQTYEFNFKPHTIYPPGFPLFIAGVAHVSKSRSHEILVTLMPVLGAASLLVWFFVLRHVGGSLAAGAACLLTATSPAYYQLASQAVSSDLLYGLISGVALLSVIRLGRTGTDWKRRGAWSALCVTACLGAVLVRSVGVALCAGLLAWAVLRWKFVARRWTPSLRAAALASVLGLVAMSGWVWWAKSHEQLDYSGQHMTSYASLFFAKDPHQPELGRATADEIVTRITSNLPVRAARTVELLLRVPYVLPAWYSPLAVAMIALLLLGLLPSPHSPWHALLALYFSAYLGVILLWPFEEGPRLILPIAPLAFLLAWRGLTATAVLLRLRPAQSLTALLLTAALCAIGSRLDEQATGSQFRVSLLFWPALGGTALLLLALLRVARLKSLWRSAFRCASERTVRRAALCAIVLLCTLGVWRQTAIARSNLAPTPEAFRHYASAHCAAWLRTAPLGIVMAEQTAILHRLTGRKVVVFPITSDAAIIADAIRRANVRYLVVADPRANDYFLPAEAVRLNALQRAYPDRVSLVHRGPGYRVFVVNEPHARLTAPSATASARSASSPTAAAASIP